MSADCRPPAFADEGSVNLTRNHHPAREQVIHIMNGTAGVFMSKTTFYIKKGIPTDTLNVYEKKLFHVLFV